MKRVTTLALALLLLLSCALSIPAVAQEVQPYASYTICNSSGALKTGSQSGQLKIEYSVTANMRATSLGVASIELYKMNGDYVDTITGTVKNGLVGESKFGHMGTYYYNDATPGEYYYAEVTVFAATDTVYDDYTHLTSTVKAGK